MSMPAVLQSRQLGNKKGTSSEARSMKSKAFGEIKTRKQWNEITKWDYLLWSLLTEIELIHWHNELNIHSSLSSWLWRHTHLYLKGRRRRRGEERGRGREGGGGTKSEEHFYSIDIHIQNPKKKLWSRIYQKRYEIERKCKWKLDRKPCMGFQRWKYFWPQVTS